MLNYLFIIAYYFELFIFHFKNYLIQLCDIKI